MNSTEDNHDDETSSYLLVHSNAYCVPCAVAILTSRRTIGGLWYVALHTLSRPFDLDCRGSFELQGKRSSKPPFETM